MPHIYAFNINIYLPIKMRFKISHQHNNNDLLVYIYFYRHFPLSYSKKRPHNGALRERKIATLEWEIK